MQVKCYNFNSRCNCKQNCVNGNPLHGYFALNFIQSIPFFIVSILYKYQLNCGS